MRAGDAGFTLPELMVTSAIGLMVAATLASAVMVVGKYGSRLVVQQTLRTDVSTVNELFVNSVRASAEVRVGGAGAPPDRGESGVRSISFYDRRGRLWRRLRFDNTEGRRDLYIMDITKADEEPRWRPLGLESARAAGSEVTFDVYTMGRSAGMEVRLAATAGKPGSSTWVRETYDQRIDTVWTRR